MPTANARKGSATERMVAAYLREQSFWMADRRLREGRADDMGDIDGVPFTVIQVKYVRDNRYAEWITDTLKQRNTAKVPYCLLVRRIPQKPVHAWEALMPLGQLYPEQIFGEERVEGWVRMDLALAVALLRRLTTRYSELYSSTTSTDSTPTQPETTTPSSAPSTEKTDPASPTT